MKSPARGIHAASPRELSKRFAIVRRCSAISELKRHKRRVPLPLCLAFASLLASLGCNKEQPAVPSAAAPAVVAKDYPLPELGTLHLAVPAGWQDSFNKTIVLGTRKDDLMFKPAQGSNFVVLVSAVHMDGTNAQAFNIKGTLAEAASAELPDFRNHPLDLHDLSGPEVTGSYLSAADPSPKPGEFKYLTLSYARLGSVILTLRVVSNETNGTPQAAALDMIKSARLTMAP